LSLSVKQSRLGIKGLMPTGEGIASYMNDGGMDLAPQAKFTGETLTDVTAQAVPLTGVVAYYDHWWSEYWLSSIGYCSTTVDNTNFQYPGAFHQGYMPRPTCRRTRVTI
jgi:hypothetical protein